MHYKNGREAKELDPVIHRDNYEGAPVRAGTLHKLNPGCDTCNAQLAVVEVGGIGQLCVTVGNCLHAEDAMLAYTTIHCPSV